MQGEEATCNWQAQEDLVVGSEDATTCVILAIRCAATKRVYVAHHNGASCRVNVSDMPAHKTDRVCVLAPVSN